MKNVHEKRQGTWQSAFVEMIPELKRRLGTSFRDLDPEAREDSIGEAIVHSLLAYVRLHERGRAQVATASTLAWYAALAVKRGRPAGNRINGEDPLSRYAQLSKGFQLEHRHGNWLDLMVEDKRATIFDQVSAKLDVGAWFGTLSRRMKEIARDLAHGSTTSEVATRYGLSCGRISQLRRELEQSWADFQHQGAIAAVR